MLFLFRLVLQLFAIVATVIVALSLLTEIGVSTTVGISVMGVLIPACVYAVFIRDAAPVAAVELPEPPSAGFRPEGFDPLGKLAMSRDTGVRSLAKEALRQRRQLEQSRAQFQDALRQKFHPSEITYGRYDAAVSKLERCINDNLFKAANELYRLEDLDYAGTTQKYLALKQLPSLCALKMQQLRNAKQRRAAIKDQVEVTRSRLGDNEAAIGRIEELTTALLRLEIGMHGAVGGMESLIYDLEALTAQVERYR